MGFNLLPAGDLKKILEEIGKKIVSLHKERIQRQVQVDGSAMPPLRPRTIEMKEKKGGRSKKNATKRMIDTGDFMQNAFKYNATPEGLEIYISKDPHLKKAQSDFHNAIENKKSRKPTLKNNNISYRMIAMSQESTKYGKNRNEHNPGANFFGLHEGDIIKYRDMFMDKAIPIIKRNFMEYLNKTLRIKK